MKIIVIIISVRDFKRESGREHPHGHLIELYLFRNNNQGVKLKLDNESQTATES